MFNNRLLRFGLDHMEIIQWGLDYQDTKTYIHVTPLEKEYEVEIGGPYGLSNSKISLRSQGCVLDHYFCPLMDGKGGFT